MNEVKYRCAGCKFGPCFFIGNLLEHEDPEDCLPYQCPWDFNEDWKVYKEASDEA